MDRYVRKIISGVELEFPFQPYPNQLVMMNKVLNALNAHQNALLESPTGTGTAEVPRTKKILSPFFNLLPGKTLSLLCASLAWQRAENLARQTEIKSDPDCEMV
jgi:Rad3-related DNA helicase